MPKTILQLCPRLNSGGIERGTVDVAKAVAAAGDVSIVASAGGYLEPELHQAGVTHIKLPLQQKNPRTVYQNAKKLAHLIQTHGIDLVHARSRIPAWTAVKAKHYTAFPLVTACHSLHDNGWLNLKKIYNRAITYGDRVVATSDCVVDYLQHEYATPRDKIIRIYRGIDEHYFDCLQQRHAARKQLLADYQIPLNKKLLLMPGRITRWKGQDVFLRAFAKLAPKHDAVAVIVGAVRSYEYQQQLRAIVDENNLQQDVFFIEEAQDMRLWYAASDIAVSASVEPESFGRIAVESQASGCITVATELGGAKETVINNETGFLVKPGSDEAMLAGLEKALSLSVAQSESLIARAQQRVMHNFTKKIMLEKTLVFYQKMLS